MKVTEVHNVTVDFSLFAKIHNAVYFFIIINTLLFHIVMKLCYSCNMPQAVPQQSFLFELQKITFFNFF